MNAKGRFKTLANMVAVIKEDKLFSVEKKVLVGTLANTPAEKEMQRFEKTLANLPEKALADTVRDNSGQGPNVLQHSGRSRS